MEELNWKYWYTDVDKDKNQYTYEELVLCQDLRQLKYLFF